MEYTSVNIQMITQTMTTAGSVAKLFHHIARGGEQNYPNAWNKRSTQKVSCTQIAKTCTTGSHRTFSIDTRDNGRNAPGALSIQSAAMHSGRAKFCTANNLIPLEIYGRLIVIDIPFPHHHMHIAPETVMTHADPCLRSTCHSEYPSAPAGVAVDSKYTHATTNQA